MVERYDLNQLAVVDEEGMLLGQITSEDAISVLKRESTEDLQRMQRSSVSSSASSSCWAKVARNASSPLENRPNVG